MYVHGDYNTVDKKGAAVIGDAINLLSNSWDGTKSGSLPNASETTFNFAMITGSYESVPNRYNGGLENLPRFHEKGPVCPATSRLLREHLRQPARHRRLALRSDRYTAPIRNWEYDESFNSLGGLPPFTPMAVSAAPVVAGSARRLGRGRPARIRAPGGLVAGELSRTYWKVTEKPWSGSTWGSDRRRGTSTGSCRCHRAAPRQGRSP